MVTLNGGNLEVRSDTSVSYPNTLSMTGSGTVSVAQLPGGTGAAGGYGNTVTFAAFTAAAAGQTTTFAGLAGTGANDGYSVALTTVTTNVATATLSNNLAQPGRLTIGSVTSAATGANVVTIAGNGVTTVTGDVTTGGATSLGLVYSGSGVLNLNGTAASNYAGGLQLTGSGTLRVNSANSLGAAGNVVALTAGVLDVRMDAGTTYPNPLTLGSTTINVDRAVGGTGSNQTHAFSGLATFNAAGRTLTVTGGDGYGLTLGGGVTMPGAETITNNASGLLTVGGTGGQAVTNTATSTLTVNGGGSTKLGDVTQSGAATPMSLTYTGTGLLDLSATNVGSPAQPYAGGLTLNGVGTVRAGSPNNLGAGGVTIGGGVTLQWRSDASATLLQPFSVTGSFTVDVGAATTATNRTLTIASISVPGATGTSQTFTGRDGHSVAIGTLALPGTSGQTTTLVANVPVTVTGNVTNNQTGFATNNFDTLVLDGAAGGSILGTISDSPTGSKTLGGYSQLTKQGGGTWTLLGANSTYTGLTSITGGTLVLGAAGAISSTNSVTVNGAQAVLANSADGALAGAGTSLTLSNGSVYFPNANSYTGNTTVTAGTMWVGHVGALGTGSLLFNGGTLSATADLTAGVPNAVVLAGNGTIGGTNKLNLSGSFTNSGASRTLTVNNTALTTLSGPVYLSEAVATARALTIAGTGPVTVSGAVADANGVGAAGTLNYAGTGTLTLAGASTYTGASNFSGAGSTVRLTGSLGNTAVNVSAGTLAPAPGTTIGSTANAAAGATLTIGAGAGLNLADGAVGTFTVLGGSTFAAGTTSLTLTTTTLGFDVDFGSSTADQILVGAGGTSRAVAGGGNTVNLSLAGTPAVGSYTLISATDPGSALNGGTYSLGTPGSVTVGGTTYLLQLVSSPTSLVLNVSTGTGNLPVGYWASRAGNGSANTASWSTVAGAATNFSSDPAGTAVSPFLPDLNTNLVFTATSASNLATTLDGNFTVNSLTFAGTGTANTAGTSIAPGTGGSGASNTLTINAAAVSDGLTVQAGSGPNVISARVALGATQSWAVNASSLTVSGVIGDGGSNYGLVKTGAGTLTLSGNNTFGGGLTVAGGTVNLNAQGTGPTNSAVGTGPLTLSGGTIDVPAGPVDLTGTTNNAQVWSMGGTVNFAGTNPLNLGTGAVRLGVDSGPGTFTLNNNSPLPGVTLRVGGAITSATGGTAGAKTIVVGGAGNTALTGNITTGAAQSLTITDNSPGTLTLSGTSSITALNLNGGDTGVVDIGAGSLTINAGGGNTIQSSTGGTINATGGGAIVLGVNNVNGPDNGTANGTTLTINARVTGNSTFEFFRGGVTTGVIVLANPANDFVGGIVANTGVISVAAVGNAGSPGPLGTGANLYFGGGALRYTGAGETSNKVVNLYGTTAGGTIEQAGTGLLKITGDFATPGGGSKTLTLTGSTAGAGELAGVIRDAAVGQTTAIAKTGTGTWALTGANTYTGATTVAGGTLVLGGSAGATSGVTINAGTGT
ncbi:MAG TPA: autotransporter-associated beta strand repeat-containing protein, partial [Humisphaera sp.]